MKPRFFNFGIDTIRFNFDAKFNSPAFASFFRGLSTNSNQKFGINFLGYEFTTTWILQNKQIELIQFDYAGDSVFALARVLNGGIMLKISYIATFYGAAFYVDDLDRFLFQFLERYLPHISLSRLDICLDTDIPVSKLWKSHTTQFRKKQFHENDGEMETFYLGAKKNNKKYFIRVYDKKLDSQNKGKFHLFFGYLKEDVVTRIEVELHTKTIKDMNITPKIILDSESQRLEDKSEMKNALHVIFSSLCLNSGGTCFSDLLETDIAKAKRIRTAVYTGKKEDVTLIAQVPYLKDFLGRARRIREMGIDPIQFLQIRL